MGWWSQDEKGHSFAQAREGEEEMMWGDPVADIMGDALAEITIEFEKAWARQPTPAEIRAGLEFSLRGQWGDDAGIVA